MRQFGDLAFESVRCGLRATWPSARPFVGWPRVRFCYIWPRFSKHDNQTNYYRKKTMLKKILPFTLLAMSGAASAAGGYLGIGFGESSADVVPTYTGATSVSDTDTAFKIFGGYEFNRSIALEGGYANFGEAVVDYALWNDYEKFEASAFYVAAVGSIPLGPVSLFGKAGLAHWFVDYTDYWDGWGTWTDSATGINPMFGFGVKIDAGNAFALRGEFERFLDVGDEYYTGQSDVDVLSISAIFKF
jgi:OOP family OmpA-OmpF porin